MTPRLASIVDRILANRSEPSGPGEAWLNANPNKAPVCRALKIDPADPVAAYATLPFTLMRDTEDRMCIAGAVGAWRVFSPLQWTPEHVAAVVLWDPLSGALSLYGDTGTALVTPFRPEPRLTIYADGFAFFRAWADRRAATWTALASAAQLHRTAHAEPADSDIPGALVIGDLNRIDWLSADATVLVAGPGIDAKQLNRAVIRSARLPRIESLAA